MRIILYILCALFIGSTQLTAQDKNSSLTHGNVQLTLKVNETTQLEVLEAFGAPNITTVDANGNEVWVFRRHATVSKSNSSSLGFKIGILGGGGGVGAGGGFGIGKNKNSAEQTYRSMTLIIKFGADNVVNDFKSRSSSF